ncbi:extracellular solute-binding protein [Halonotius terrestris]|uniref:Extracellular solute-binding protein n=2 Tax=Halonotius terrestris TaxID=2487750 RepID=A0A8J8TBM6_9EURY|nr:extracellular solute-binding protein [Halonotius terrestris]
MADQATPTNDAQTGSITRRRVLQATGVAGMASIAGCYGDSGSDAVVISGNQNLAQNLDIQAFYDAGVSEEIDIEISAGPEDTDSRSEAFVSTLDAGQSSPDIMMMDNGWTIPFISRGDIANLEAEMDSSFIEEVKADSFDMLVRTASNPNTGEMWALPFFPDYPTMQYRKDLFRAAGYSDSDFETWATDPPSWEEWSATVAEVHEQSDVDYGYVWQADSYAGLSCCSFNELMSTYGGAYFGDLDNLFGPVGDRPVTVEDEAVLESINVARDMVYGNGEASQDITQCAPEEVFGWSEPDTDGAFVGDSNAVAMRNWTYTIGMAEGDEQFTEGEELGVMPMPYGRSESEVEADGLGGTVSAQGGWLLGVNPHTNDMAETLEVLRAVHSEEVQAAVLDGPGFLPHQPDLVESLAGDHPAYGDYSETLAIAGDNAVSRPVTPVWPQQSQQVHQEVNDAFQGNKTPSAAMSDLSTALSDLEDL